MHTLHHVAEGAVGGEQWPTARRHASSPPPPPAPRPLRGAFPAARCVHFCVVCSSLCTDVCVGVCVGVCVSQACAENYI